ncbi:hypothetical protein NP233_g13054 [Leucocoprinus birnbaumii]|uniref:Uncharacterized protein n=1 Tax=Leucocoprinus birnbaumii TaxID=56174 RepID=A0AAD5VDC5_9AGAR|nr:hypothetical protein NP233_g13054 [Leucocoprinus birnbaumii]
MFTSKFQVLLILGMSACFEAVFPLHVTVTANCRPGKRIIRKEAKEAPTEEKAEKKEGDPLEKSRKKKTKPILDERVLERRDDRKWPGKHDTDSPAEPLEKKHKIFAVRQFLSFHLPTRKLNLRYLFTPPPTKSQSKSKPVTRTPDTNEESPAVIRELQTQVNDISNPI